MILFRCGKRLITGEAVNEQEGVYILRTTPPEGTAETVAVHESFVVNRDFHAERWAGRYADVVAESLVPLLAGRRHLRLGEHKVIAFEKQGRGVGLLSETEQPSWVDARRILEQPELGGALALEAHRDTLEKKGLVEVGAAVQGAFVELHRPLKVLMKRDPFRDVTTLHPGTMVEVCGYYKGCATIEADGEPFWLPLEPLEVIESSAKDPDYYFDLDSNYDFIPDPLETLPSKAGLGQEQYTTRDNNYNAIPYDKTVAGQWHALPAEVESDEEEHEFGAIDDGLDQELRESYGALYYYCDYPAHYPELHHGKETDPYRFPEAGGRMQRVVKAPEAVSKGQTCRKCGHNKYGDPGHQCPVCEGECFTPDGDGCPGCAGTGAIDCDEFGAAEMRFRKWKQQREADEFHRGLKQALGQNETLEPEQQQFLMAEQIVDDLLDGAPVSALFAPTGDEEAFERALVETYEQVLGHKPPAVITEAFKGGART